MNDLSITQKINLDCCDHERRSASYCLAAIER